jgi:transposase
MHVIAEPTRRPTIISGDVGSEKINLFCRDLSKPGAVAEWVVDNRSEAIRSTLKSIREQAESVGIDALQIVVEPTGIYHKLLLRIARSLGFDTALVDASHVKKMRSVIFGDSGKTDERDPYAIEAVAVQGPLIADRQRTEVYDAQDLGKALPGRNAGAHRRQVACPSRAENPVSRFRFHDGLPVRNIGPGDRPLLRARSTHDRSGKFLAHLRTAANALEHSPIVCGASTDTGASDDHWTIEDACDRSTGT